MAGISEMLAALDEAAATFGVQGIWLILVFASVFLAVLGGALLITSRQTLGRRLEVGHSVRSLATVGDGSSSAEDSFIVRALEKLSTRVMPKKDSDYSRIRQKLMRAGYMHRRGVHIFYTTRLVLSVLLPGIFIILSPLASREIAVEQILWMSGVLAIVGLYLPSLWISHRIGRRQLSVQEAFPDALDMLLVSVEAGLSLDASINRVGKEIGKAHPILGEQFDLTGLELRAGKSRQDALRNLADRTGVDEVSSLVTLLIQSDALGTSIAHALRVHADEMRAKRTLTAEEKAHKLPVKLSVPLVTLILPALIIVILSPSVINIIRDLLPVLSQTDFNVLSGKH